MAKSKLVRMNERIAATVTEGYQKIEDGVVGGYKKIENGVVDGFTKMTDKIVDQFLTRGERRSRKPKSGSPERPRPGTTNPRPDLLADGRQ